MWKALVLVCLSFFVCACENGTIEYRGKDIQGTSQTFGVPFDYQPTVECLNGVAYWHVPGGITVMFDKEGKVVQCRRVYPVRSAQIGAK